LKSEIKQLIVFGIETKFQLFLPLMTTYATFIINGCERVIVSQIIEALEFILKSGKNQKNQKQFKRKLTS
jgi:DNA-directed RNA polymerase beta subunit